MGVVFVGLVFRGVVLVVVVVFVFLLAYYLAYSLSFIYLRPYMHYYLEVVDSHARVFNLPMLIIFVSSPFNAYEAVLIHTNPAVYFLGSVIMPVAFVLVFLALYELAVYWLGVRSIIELVSFVRFILLASLVDSWLVSLVRWLWFGVPSVGTSIFTVFQFAAMTYIVIILIIQVIKVARLMRVRRGPNLQLATIYVLIVAIIMLMALTVLYIFVALAPVMDINHVMGLLMAVPLIYVYHKCKIMGINVKLR